MAGKSPTTSTPRGSKRRIKVGDHIILHLGVRDFHAEVVEDRGFIGVGGRQLIRIRKLGVPPEMSEPYEVPAEEVELVEKMS